jgi:hypothetical protein
MSDQPVQPDEAEDAAFARAFGHFFPGRNGQGIAIENVDDDDGIAAIDRFFPGAA